MSLADYAGLQAAITTRIHRSDKAADIPDYITEAEGEMNARLRVRRMIRVATSSVSNASTALPSDFLAPITVRISEMDPALDNVTLDEIATRRRGSSGRVLAYAIGSAIEFGPDPGSAQTVYLTYYQAIPPLALNSTNWLLTTFPQVYLAGTMVAYCLDVQDEMLATWAARFDRALEQVRVSDQSAYGQRLTPSARTIV